MNKKVLKTMITLVVVFLVALYVLKIFFPEQFVMAIQNEQFINIGSYIDNNLWAYIVFTSISSFIIYWLFIGATTIKWKLSWKEILLVMVVIASTRLLYLHDYDLATSISTLSMFIIPTIFGANAKDLVSVYSIHYVSQLLSLKIRNLPLLFSSVNSIIAIFMTLECYFWLLLFYIYNNYKKEK